VVDQSDAPDAHLQALSHPNVDIHYVHTSAVGKSRSINRGIELARGEVIALTDDDVLVDAGWLAAIVGAVVEGGPQTVATGRVLPLPGGGTIPVSVQTSEEPRTYAGRVERDVLSGNNMALHKDACTAVGPWDERLGPGGRFNAAMDNDYGHRLLEAGCAIVYVPGAVVFHLVWRRGPELRRLNWTYGRGQGAFLAKHARLRDRYTLRRLAQHVTGRLRRIATRPLRERRTSGHGDLIYLAGLLGGALEWWLRAAARRP
jgi:GT2 family glycosyltransferase